jgi:hypothetical protein
MFAALVFKTVKGVNAVTGGRSVGCGHACQVEEDAGIRPFLEPWKTICFRF